MTTNEKKDALKAAGKKIKASATDEEIDMAYLELEVELEGSEETEALEEPEEVTITDAPADPEISVERPPADAAKTLEEVLRDANPQLGDKDPEVVKWCKENLSADEFELRYAGRKY